MNPLVLLYIPCSKEIVTLNWQSIQSIDSELKKTGLLSGASHTFIYLIAYGYNSFLKIIIDFHYCQEGER